MFFPTFSTEDFHKMNFFLFTQDQLKRRFERLSRSKWQHTDDFVPLLAVEETIIRDIQLYQAHVIRNRIYLLNELFSVCNLNNFNDSMTIAIYEF